MESLIRIGRCAVCSLVARIERGGCRPCVTRHGQRFCELAVRCRGDVAFARMVEEALSRRDEARARFKAWLAEQDTMENMGKAIPPPPW